MTVDGVAADASYSRMRTPANLLHNRKLPPKVVGDIVIVEAGDSFSTARIINSISEIKLGDLVVKK
jgi:hypothetical protein